MEFRIPRKSPLWTTLVTPFLSVAPRYLAIKAVIPTPTPVPAEIIIFCAGNDIETAVSAASFILATKRLSKYCKKPVQTWK